MQEYIQIQYVCILFQKPDCTWFWRKNICCRLTYLWAGGRWAHCVPPVPEGGGCQRAARGWDWCRRPWWGKRPGPYRIHPRHSWKSNGRARGVLAEPGWLPKMKTTERWRRRKTPSVTRRGGHDQNLLTQRQAICTSGRRRVRWVMASVWAWFIIILCCILTILLQVFISSTFVQYKYNNNTR